MVVNQVVALLKKGAFWVNIVYVPKSVFWLYEVLT
jgi:hypothetical protein